MTGRAELLAAMRAEADRVCDYKGGMGSRIRRLQGLLRAALAEMETVNEADVRGALREAVAREGQGSFARKNGILQSVVSEVASERRPVPASIANALGFIELPKRYRKHAKETP